MASYGATRQKKGDTFEGQYEDIINYHNGAHSYLNLLEPDNRFGDICFRFSNGGRTYKLHRIVLFATLGIDLSDQIIADTLNKAGCPFGRVRIRAHLWCCIASKVPIRTSRYIEDICMSA